MSLWDEPQGPTEYATIIKTAKLGKSKATVIKTTSHYNSHWHLAFLSNPRYVKTFHRRASQLKAHYQFTHSHTHQQCQWLTHTVPFPLQWPGTHISALVCGMPSWDGAQSLASSETGSCNSGTVCKRQGSAHRHTHDLH